MSSRPTRSGGWNYPKKGTFYSDHPFAIPQWVTEAKRTSALAFRNFLFASAQQKKALAYGFRPADLSIPIATSIDSRHGVDATQPKTTLQIPSVDVVQAIQAAWGQLRHRVAVMLLLDTSGSMNYVVDGIPKIKAAQQGLKRFISLLSENDWVGLTTFSTKMQVLSQVAPLGPKRQALLTQVNGISACGDIRLYDTIADQVYALNTLSSHYIKAVVVLTDGVDTISQRSLTQLLREITPTNLSTGNVVRVFTMPHLCLPFSREERAMPLNASLIFQGGMLELQHADTIERVPAPFRLVQGRWCCEAYHYLTVRSWL